MKETYTRREVLKTAAKLVVAGSTSLGAGAGLSAIDYPRANEAAVSSLEKDLSGAKEVATAALLVAGAGLLGAGLYGAEAVITDNLPNDDEGNPRELVGYTSSDHFLGPGPMPIYRDKNTDGQK